MKPWSKMSHSQKANFWGKVSVIAATISLLFSMLAIIMVVLFTLAK